MTPDLTYDAEGERKERANIINGMEKQDNDAELRKLPQATVLIIALPAW